MGIDFAALDKLGGLYPISFYSTICVPTLLWLSAAIT